MKQRCVDHTLHLIDPHKSDLNLMCRIQYIDKSSRDSWMIYYIIMDPLNSCYRLKSTDLTLQQCQHINGTPPV